MANQVADEAVHSATYVKNYLDSVENLPDDVQRLLSRIRDIDVKYRSFLREVDNHYDQWRSSSNDSTANKRPRRYMDRIKQKLIAAQELGDEKLQIVSQLQELIDQKTRQLDVDFKNLDYGKEEPMPETPQKVPRPATPVVQAPLATKVENQTFPLAQQNPQRGSTPTNQTNEKPSSNSNSERSSNKRSRRPRNETHNNSATDAGSLVESNPNNESLTPAKQNSNASANQSSNSVSASGGTSQKKGSNSGGGGGGGKKKKRKARGTASNNQSNVRDDTPPPEEPIDPDEPTYCLCDQISFGEMILCDNDLCPIEWFHFSCVSLSLKPKGKWYCPNCRGDRPNIMKPKAQFLKELERYNKEKEEKT